MGVEQLEHTGTGRGTSHAGACWGGTRGRIAAGRGVGGEIALGEILNVDDGLMGAANHHGTCMPM